MSDTPQPAPTDATLGKALEPKPPGETPAASQAVPARTRRLPWFELRQEIPHWLAVALGVLSVLVCLGIWWQLTRGAPEERVFSPSVLPSPAETFSSFHGLWFDRALTRNTWASLKRVAMGFALAAAIGVPLGVLCGCFPWVNAFFAPLTIVGRNIPVAALIPLTFSLFGIGEFQKVMFIFIATVAFVVFDTAAAIGEVSSRYIDTAYTLGASRRQIVLKVLFPLALPAIFNSMRLLFGLAFGYIMLAELVKFGGESGGLGDIINISQRRGNQPHILLVLMIIPLVALAIDRALYAVQCSLFPYRHGGSGLLHHAAKGVFHGLEDLRSLVFRPKPYGQVGANGK